MPAESESWWAHVDPSSATWTHYLVLYDATGLQDWIEITVVDPEITIVAIVIAGGKLYVETKLM